MTSYTSARSYPYPGQNDAFNVPADMQALATRLDTDVNDIASQLKRLTSTSQSGTVTVATVGPLKIAFELNRKQKFLGSVSYTNPVSFGMAGFSQTPFVVASLNSTNGGSESVVTRSTNVTTSSANITLISATYTSLRVDATWSWIAIGV